MGASAPSTPAIDIGLQMTVEILEYFRADENYNIFSQKNYLGIELLLYNMLHYTMLNMCLCMYVWLVNKLYSPFVNSARVTYRI